MRFRILACAVFIVSVFLSNPVEKVSAYPGGLLNGIPGMYLGKPVTALTDNDDTTTLGFYLDPIIFTLPKTADIKNIRSNVLGRNGDIRVSFYAESGTLIGTQTSLKPGVGDHPVDFKSVKTIRLNTTANGGWPASAAEFDVFGQYDLAMPLNVKATAGVKQINVTFEPAADATGYVIYLNGAKHKTIPSDPSAFVLDGLEPDKEYTIQLTAKHGELESKMTPEVKARPINSVVKPVITVDGVTWETIDISWTAGNGSSNQIYTVYVNSSNEGNTQTNRFTVKAKPETDYVFAVAMTDKYGRSVRSDELTVTTPSKPKDITPPDKPRNFKGQPATDRKSIRLDWSRGSEPDLAGYNVYVMVDGAYKLINSKLITDNFLSYSPVQIGKTYQFRLKALDESGNASEPIDTSVEVTPPPVTDSDQEQTPEYMLVTWEPTDGATGYEVYLNGRLVGKVGSNVFEYKITKDMGYNPGHPFNRSEVKAIFADGTTGGGNNTNTPGVTGDGWGFTPGGILESALFIIGSLAGFILLGLVIRLVPRLIELIRESATSN